MSKSGHILTGAALGAAVFAATSNAPIALACVAGSQVPDVAEMVLGYPFGMRLSLVPHRTLTHWPYLYAFGIILAATLHTRAPLAAALVLGICLGALLHLSLDILTPTGIPLGSPFGTRTSLGPYRSAGHAFCYRTGTFEEWPFLLCAVIFLIVAVMRMHWFFRFL